MSDDDEEKTAVRTGRNFEQTYRLADEEWELPFAFGDPVEVEIDFEGMDDPELELEVEIPGQPDDTAPQVE